MSYIIKNSIIFLQRLKNDLLIIIGYRKHPTIFKFKRNHWNSNLDTYCYLNILYLWWDKMVSFRLTREMTLSFFIISSFFCVCGFF